MSCPRQLIQSLHQKPDQPRENAGKSGENNGSTLGVPPFELWHRDIVVNTAGLEHYHQEKRDHEADHAPFQTPENGIEHLGLDCNLGRARFKKSGGGLSKEEELLCSRLATAGSENRLELPCTMSDNPKSELRLEIAHVLFIDIVGYSKLLIDEQSEALEKLNEIVRTTEMFRRTEAGGTLLCLPTGDGMALVFTSNAEAPVECAVEISQALKSHSSLSVRMGVHSGPVHQVADVNQRKNIAGAGINMAQRVMDCGDADHILLSKRVAEDLEQYRHWQPYLHDLGECEVKHGLQLSVVNFYTDEAGNPDLPGKFASKPVAQTIRENRRPSYLPAAIGSILILLLILAGTVWHFMHRNTSKMAGFVEKSIAVLPFENLSDERQNAYFADGVQDEILTDLARIADLKVISRTSVMQYKSGIARNLREIAQQLGVSHVVEGSVQRSANHIRVNAQLIDARNDTHLWAQTYDRDLADVFAIQSEIAKTIADQLQAKILPREKTAIEQQPTKDVAAYDLYVRATEAIDLAPNSQNAKENLLQAISLLEETIARDPAFLNAYCKLARAHDQLYLFGEDHTPGRLASAEQAINAALRLQPEAAEVHLARAGHLYSKLDYDGAREEIEIARRTLPNDPRTFESNGYIDRRQGRWQESTRNLERALEFDPNNIFILHQISTSYGALRDYPKEAGALDRILALKPNDLDARISRAQLEVFWKADTAPLHELIEASMRQNPASAAGLAPVRIFLATAERDPAAGERALADLGENTYGPDAIRYTRAFGEGFFARLKGDPVAAQAAFTKARAEQQQIVDAQPDYGPALCVLGLIDAGLGRKDNALREGRRAAEVMPPSKDSINGAHIMYQLAVIYAWVGQKELAIDQLERSAEVPASLSYGQLRLWPHWDSLRGDPRFDRLVQSYAPRQ
jgi:TolB-like protein/class 3 adenylate cyclase/Tfp pilus assembly protein PilF